MSFSRNYCIHKIICFHKLLYNNLFAINDVDALCGVLNCAAVEVVHLSCTLFLCSNSIDVCCVGYRNGGCAVRWFVGCAVLT